MISEQSSTSLPFWRLFLTGLVVIGSGCLSFVARAEELAATAPAKRIYLALDDHTDYMWTADEAYYRQAFLEMIDFYLDEMERTDSRPKNEQCRWNCDGGCGPMRRTSHRPTLRGSSNAFVPATCRCR